VCQALTIALAAFVGSKYFTTESAHLRGLVLAAAGAILLAVDPIAKLVGNIRFRHLAKADGALTEETRTALRNLQVEEYLEHSWLALFSVLIGTGLLAFGFYMDFRSEQPDAPARAAVDSSTRHPDSKP